MSLSADIVTLLKTSSPLLALCVTNSQTNSKAVRPDRLHQSDKVTDLLGGVEVTTDGNEFLNDLVSSNGTAWVKVLIDCVSRSSTTSNAMADIAQALVEPFRGATAGGFIDAVELSDRREDWATTEDGQATGEYVAELELSVFYRKS